MTDEWCGVCPLLVRWAKQSINYLFTENFTQKSPPSTTGQTTTQMINHFGSDKERNKIVFVRSLGRFWFWFSLSKLNIYDLRTWECGRKRFFLSFNRRVTCVCESTFFTFEFVWMRSTHMLVSLAERTKPILWFSMNKFSFCPTSLVASIVNCFVQQKSN